MVAGYVQTWRESVNSDRRYVRIQYVSTVWYCPVDGDEPSFGGSWVWKAPSVTYYCHQKVDHRLHPHVLFSGKMEFAGLQSGQSRCTGNYLCLR